MYTSHILVLKRFISLRQRSLSQMSFNTFPLKFIQNNESDQLRFLDGHITFLKKHLCNTLKKSSLRFKMSDWRNICLSRECMLSHVQLFATPWRLCPWDSPVKYTRVSCHFLPQGIFPTQGSNPFPASPTLASRFFATEPPGKPQFKLLFCVCVCVLAAQSCLTLWDPTDSSPTRFLHPWDSPGKNTGGGCHSLLQGNLPEPGMESGSPEFQSDSLPSELSGKPQEYWTR